MRFWFFAVVLIAAIMIVEFDISRRTQARVAAQRRAPATTQLPQSLPAVAAVVSPEPPVAVASEAVKPASFETRFNSEAQAMAQLQTDPNLVEKRLEDLALSLTTEDIESLKKIMNNADRNGDDRALAIELLSRKKTPQSLAALEGFVQSHQTTTKENWSRPQEFNSVGAAQAIEGIAAYPEKDKALTALDSLAKTVDESFLLDRIARSKQSLIGNTDATEEQDNGALKQFVQ
ncbi:MAG: hypothetical protein H7061_03245 [Bdellovibrionaceae bacterium]|nr:hypothetical protein [Bdellovibrio sp.]